MCSLRKKNNTKEALFVTITSDNYSMLEKEENIPVLKTFSLNFDPEKKVRKNKSSEGFLLNIKQVYPRRSLEGFSGEYGR